MITENTRSCVAKLSAEFSGRGNEAEAIVENAPCMSLIDTGSQICTLSHSFYKKHLPHIELKSLDPLLQVTAAGGQRLPYIGIVEVSIRFGRHINGTDHEYHVPVLVVPDTQYNEQVPLLIGTNVIELCLNDFQSDSENDKKAKIAKAWDMGYRSMSSQPSFHFPVLSCNKITVPGDTRVILKAKVKQPKLHKRTCVVTESHESCLPGGLVIAPCVIELKPGDKQTEVMVEVQNFSGQSVTIPKNYPVCNFQPVELLESYNGTSSQCHNLKVNASDNEQFLNMFDLTSLGENLSPCEIKEVEKLLCKYKDIFSLSEYDFGHTNIIKHRIDLTDDIPVRERHRYIAPALYQEVRRHLNEMLEHGIIRESSSPYAAPLVIVRKKNGSLRLCMDYRGINRKTVRDAYYMPRISETLNALHGSKWFSCMDLTSGYWQVEVQEEHRERTAFTAGPLGLWECCSMPFGLTNAPGTFQRLMEKCVGELQPSQCLVYLDDLTVHSTNVPQHLERLEAVFRCLRSANLKVKPEKCVFFGKSVTFLGHVISEAGIATDPAKTEALTSWPVPSTVEELRRFLGFAGYYRQFVENYSQIARPLTKLLGGTGGRKKKGQKRKSKKTKTQNPKWEWTEEQQSAFDTLVSKLTTAPTLAYADFSRPFELHCDASSKALGAVLYQKQEGKLRVIAYASRALKGSELNYPAHKLEFLALKWAVSEKFNDYLYGQQFEVKTDNNPLTYVLTTAKLDATCHRWLASLAMYNFSISYRAGRQNIDADALSRRPFQTDNERSEVKSEAVAAVCQGMLCQVNLVETLCLSQHVLNNILGQTPGDVVDIAELQKADVNISRVLFYISKGQRPSMREVRSENWTVRKLLVNWDGLEQDLESGVLYRIRQTADGSFRQLILPESCIADVFKHLHEDTGHPGREKTLELIRKRFFWPGMFRDIEKRVTECHRCLCRKAGVRKEVAPMVGVSSSAPLELVCVDFLSMPPSRGYENILVITDHFSKLAHAVPTKNQTAKTTAKALYENFIVYYGVPSRLHADQGRNFESTVIKELCQILGIQKSRTTPYHAMGNGCAEVMNKTLLSRIGTLPQEKKSAWKDHLSTLVHAYNCTPHDSTGYAPYELIFGRMPYLPVDLKYGLTNTVRNSANYTDYITDLKMRLEYAFEKAQTAAKNSSRKQKEYYDRKARAAVLSKGDRVLVRKTGVHEHDKLADKWESETYVVVEQPNPSIPVYVVKPEAGRKKRVLHRNLLLPIGMKGEDSTVENPSSHDAVGALEDEESEWELGIVGEPFQTTTTDDSEEVTTGSPAGVPANEDSVEVGVTGHEDVEEVGLPQNLSTSNQEEGTDLAEGLNSVEDGEAVDSLTSDNSSQEAVASADEIQETAVAEAEKLPNHQDTTKTTRFSDSLEAEDQVVAADTSVSNSDGQDVVIPTVSPPDDALMQESEPQIVEVQDQVPEAPPKPAPRKSLRVKRKPAWLNSEDWVFSRNLQAEQACLRPEWAKRADYFMSLVLSNPALMSQPEFLESITEILKPK